MPKVIAFIDLHGVLTGKPSTELHENAFYRSFFRIYDPPHYFLKYPEEVQSLLIAKFGEYKEPFDYEQKGADLLITPGALNFLRQCLVKKDVNINIIISHGSKKYIHALLEYQGFSPEEIGKLNFLEVRSEGKNPVVYDHLTSQFCNLDVKQDLVFILDDEEDEFREMRWAAKSVFGSRKAQIHGNHALPGRFDWEEYLTAIEEWVPKVLSNNSNAFNISNAETTFSSDVSLLTVNEMAIAVDASRAHAADKGISFNCSVLAGEKSDVSELENFLRELEKNIKQYPDNTRIQYIFGYKANTEIMHWTTADIRIKNGKLEFYLLDAAGVLSGLVQQVALIQKICPDAVIRSSELQIQKDLESCAWFALDHAMGLAKIPDLHEQLDAIEERSLKNPFNNKPIRYGEMKLYDVETKRNFPEFTDPVAHLAKNYFGEPQMRLLRKGLEKLKFIDRDSLAKRFGSLFKNSQDLTIDTHNVLLHNTTPLANFLKNNLKENRNQAIFKKKKKTKERFLAHMSIVGETGCKKIIAERQAIHISEYRRDHLLSNSDKEAKMLSQPTHGHVETEAEVKSARTDSSSETKALPQITESDAKREIILRYNQLKTKDWFARENLDKTMSLKDILIYAQKGNNRTRRACVSLGWMDSKGNLTDDAPSVLHTTLSPKKTGMSKQNSRGKV